MLFLQILSKPKFSCIEKIKTIGSTYMIASGLNPGKEDGDGVSFIYLFCFGNVLIGYNLILMLRRMILR